MKFLAVLIASIAIPAFFVSGDSSAASQSFSYDSSSDPKPQQVFWTGDNSYNGLTFTPTYVVIEGVATRNDTQVAIGRVSPYAYGSYQIFYVVPDSSNHFYAVLNMPWGLNGQFINISSITYTFYDYNPASNEPCPDCPEIPVLPYGEKFDRLTAAIIFVPATLLVIYFMFAIYSMFFRGLK